MSTGVGHLAKREQDGLETIPNENMLFPFEVILEPNRVEFDPATAAGK